MFDRPSGFATDADFWRLFVPGLTGAIGSRPTLSLNIPDFIVGFLRSVKVVAGGLQAPEPARMLL